MNPLDTEARARVKATVHRGYRFRLYPTPAQEAALGQVCGTIRAVYNAALEQRRDFWRQHKRVTGYPISFAGQSAEVKHLRAEFDWIAAAPYDALTYALRDLDTAFLNFFAGRARYPDFRRRGVLDGFRLKGVNSPLTKLNGKWALVRVPKLGEIKLRAHRPVVGVVRSVAFSHRDGCWWVAFTAESEIETGPGSAAQVGIDRGIVRTLSLSTGEVIQAPDCSLLLARRKRAQRALSKAKRGSQRRQARKAEAARLGAKITRIRTDWCHRASTDIARRFGLVAIEALNIPNMTASARGTVEEPGRNVRQKAGLNRSILEQSWGRFANYLDYKLSERGGELITVPAAYTSQTCSACGVIDARSRESQAVFKCVACDHTMNADHNAACEILRRSTAIDVEGWVTGPSKRQPKGRCHVQ